MRKTFLSIGASILLLTGCAGVSPSLNETFNKVQANKGGLKEYIVEANKNDYHGVKIFADKPNETILKTRVYNVNGVGISDIYEVTNQLSYYCEKIGGKWIYGKQYGYLLKRHGNVYLNPILSLKTVPQQLKAEESNYNGFGKCEAGKNSFEVNYEIGRFAINTINWSRFYKVTFAKPQKTDDYIVKSFYALLHKSPVFKSWDNFLNYLKTHKRIDAFGKGANFLANSYILCLSKGGSMYISNKNTNFKKMNFNDYVFKLLDLYHKEYPYGTDGNYGINELSLFAGVGKNYYWCENNKFPQYQFTFTSHKDNYGWTYYTFKLGVDKKLKDLQKTKDFFTTKIQSNNFSQVKKNKVIKQISASIGSVINSTPIPDRNAYNLARGVFTIRGDIKVANNPYVKYYGYYIGKIGSCEYASVEKKGVSQDIIYNFKKCNGNIEYTGQTLKGLTQAEYNRFSPYLNGLKQSCETDGEALVQVNGINLYCKSNKNGGYKVFILNRKFQLINEIE